MVPSSRPATMPTARMPCLEGLLPRASRNDEYRLHSDPYCQIFIIGSSCLRRRLYRLKASYDPVEPMAKPAVENTDVPRPVNVTPLSVEYAMVLVPSPTMTQV